MVSVPKKVEERLKVSLKQFVPILTSLRDRDVAEADTVTVVKDLLSEMFGFDKYAEITSEFAIRGTYCDLALKIDNKLKLLLEVKAIGLDLNERHIKQAVDYAANQGLDWVVLTNGIRWMLYNIEFKKPIGAKLLAELDLLTVNLKNEGDLERLFLLTKEGMLKGAVASFKEKQGATSKHMIAAVLMHDEDVLNVIRRELRRVTDLLVPTETIAQVLRTEVIKRDALEGEEAAAAERTVTRKASKSTERAPSNPPTQPSTDRGPQDPTQPS